MTSSTSTLCIHLLCMEEKFITAWKDAVETYQLPNSIEVIVHHDRLAELPSSVKFDAIVSPANSFGRMDGGFDDALSRAFSPPQDYYALTKVVRSKLYKEWHGYAPPGTCTLVDLGGQDVLKKNEWGCRYLALSPTMKVPHDVNWDREVVYECIWSLLAAIDKHNRDVGERIHRGNTTEEGGESEIKGLLMTPLATGYGRWSPEKWAAQTVLALKHFAEAVERGEDEQRYMEPFMTLAHWDEMSKTYTL